MQLLLQVSGLGFQQVLDCHLPKTQIGLGVLKIIYYWIIILTTPVISGWWNTVLVPLPRSALYLVMVLASLAHTYYSLIMC